MKVHGRRKIGRPKRRWLDRVKDDIKEKGLSGEEVYDRPTELLGRCIHIRPNTHTLSNDLR